MTGLEIPGEGLARKRTGVRTTRRGLAEGLFEYQCDKQHERVHLEGNIPGTNLHRTSFAENYGTLLAKILSDLLEQPPPQDSDILVLGLEAGEDA
eukprot:870818-Pyramimonas_sp.AAC.1